jgi:hypothetical protein
MLAPNVTGYALAALNVAESDVLEGTVVVDPQFAGTEYNPPAGEIAPHV